MRLSLTAVGAALALWPAAAQAQWLHMKGNDDPFSGRGRQLVALTVSSVGTSVGFRCTSADDLTLLLVTPERPNSDITPLLGKIPVKILVIVDDRPKVELDAEIGLTPDGKQLRLESDDSQVIDVLHATAAAKRRVAVAAEMLGNTFYSFSYQATNSRRALQPLIAGCKLPGPDAKAKIN